MPTIQQIIAVPDGHVASAKVLLPHEDVQYVIEGGHMQVITTVTSVTSADSIRQAYSRFHNNNPGSNHLIDVEYAGTADDFGNLVFALYASNSINDFNKVLNMMGNHDNFELIFVGGFSDSMFQKLEDTDEWGGVFRDKDCREALCNGSEKPGDIKLMENKNKIYDWYFLRLKAYLAKKLQGRKQLDPLLY